MAGGSAMRIRNDRDACCRCVCRSWRNLLSDPNFLRKIISFKAPDQEESTFVTGRAQKGAELRTRMKEGSCFMSKGMLVATLLCPCSQRDMGVAESWIKLFTLDPPLEALFCNLLDLWKDGMYICSYSNIHTGHHKVFSFDAATKEIVHDHLEIKDTCEFRAHTFVPTPAVLTLQAAEVTSSSV